MNETEVKKRARQVLKEYRSKLRIGQIEETAEIERAISLLSDNFRDILKSRYINRNAETVSCIALRMGYSEKAIQNWSAQATMQFAEAYKSGTLLQE